MITDDRPVRTRRRSSVIMGRAGQLTAHGTLYKALARLERAGMLTSSWEDPGLAEAESRPRRRLYRVTPSGEQAVLHGIGQRASTTPRPDPGLAPA
jgi:hypothetical protein